MAIVFSEEMTRYVKEWNCVDERIVVARLQIEGKWITYISVYAPTDDSSQKIKDGFYKKLQNVVDKTPRGEKLVILGDLNARVGNNNDGWKEVLGTHGEVTRNGNGKRLLEFCMANDTLIMNSWFQHKEIQKYTWENESQQRRSVIDYCLVRRSLRSLVMDVTVVRGGKDWQ